MVICSFCDDTMMMPFVCSLCMKKIVANIDYLNNIIAKILTNIIIKIMQK